MKLVRCSATLEQAVIVSLHLSFLSQSKYFSIELDSHIIYFNSPSVKTIEMNISLAGIILSVILLVTLTHADMAEKPKAEKPKEVASDEPEVDEEGYERGLTSEEIMNLPDMPDQEDEETAGMTIDEIIERANHMGRGNHAEVENPDGPYIVQGDIAMTKEQYEEHMAEWKVQEAELIAKGIIKPDK